MRNIRTTSRNIRRRATRSSNSSSRRRSFAHQVALPVAIALAAATAAVSASGAVAAAEHPQKGFGASLTPAYDGWCENADGTKTLLVELFNRNWSEELDIPVRAEQLLRAGRRRSRSANALRDQSQLRHVHHHGAEDVFANGTPVVVDHAQRCDAARRVDPQPRLQHHAAARSEESPGGKYNLPPLLHHHRRRVRRCRVPWRTWARPNSVHAKVGEPMPLELWAGRRCAVFERFERPDGHPYSASRRICRGQVSRARHRDRRRELQQVTTLKGGKPAEDFAGTARTTVTFSEPGDYVLHITANDYSGKGGGATGCCWTTSHDQGGRLGGTITAHRAK